MTHNFLKYGYAVSESNNNLYEININQKKNSLNLSCTITEFTDSEMIVVPYRNEDRGYVETTINQSTDQNGKNQKSEMISSSTTKTHSGNIIEGSKIEYTESSIVHNADR